MPGTNSFYPYGESSTNILNNSEYQTDSERSSGAQSGAIARSKMYNKQARQAAAGAYAVGALVAKSGKNADDSSAATLAANFQGAVSYQAAHFVASDVSVSGTTATATVAELATTAAADLPALFALSLVLDQALPAGASIAIASSLPDVTLSWPIYVGSEALDSDTITGGAITLLIDTVGAKAFFKAGGGRYKPTDLPPLNPNFTMEISEGDSEDTVTVTADKLTISPTTNMLAGGQWEYGTEMSPAPGKGQNIKHWTREQLVTSGKPFDGLLLGDVTASDAVNETILWLPENQNGETVLVPFIVLSVDYLGGVYVIRKNAFGSSVWDNGEDGYEDSALDNYFVNTYLNSVLSDSVGNEIMTVPIEIRSASNTSDTRTINRKIFAPSLYEFGLTDSIAHEGTPMPYFNSSERRRTGTDEAPNTAVVFDTRTWAYSAYGSVQPATHWSIDTNGVATGTTNQTANATRPAFVLPKDFQIQQRPDGSYTVWNEQGLMTLGDIEASNTSTTSIVNVTESGQLAPFVLLSQKYNEQDISVMHRENLLPESWDSNYSGTTDYATSGIQTKFKEYAASTLDAPYRALLVSVEVTYKNLNPSDNWERKLSTKCCAIGAEELGIVSGWGLGNIFSYYESSENKKKKHDDGAYAQWYTRDIQSAFFSSNRAWDDRKPYFVSASGTTSGAPSIGHDLGLCPMLFFETTSPIRALADGSYDLVPDDPALSAQTVSTLAEEQSGTAVQLNQIPQGSVLKIKENGQDVDFYVARHNYESDLNGDGRTLVVRKDCYDNQVWDSGNVNAYAESDIDSWFNNTYKALLDESIQEAIGTTKFHYTPGNGNNTVGTLERAVFALSLTELGQSHSYANTEGSALPIASTLRIAYRNGSPTTQWTRSPYTTVTHYVWGLDSNGDIVGRNFCNNSRGSRPCFTLPGDSYATANDDGTYTFTGEDTSSPTVSFSFTVPHGTQPVVRQYTYNYEEHYQTMLEGGVLPALGGDTGPTYSEVLAENTWAQIAQAVADKDPILDAWQVGDTKDEVIAGETLTFAIMGKNMDDLADGSGKAGLTFGMTQLMAATRQMNSSNTNAGSFAGSAMYSWLSGTIYPNLPTELKDAIKAVNKKTSVGGGSSSIRTDPMYLWLFSEIEVFGTTTYSVAGEGTQSPYFATAAERIKRLSNGSGAASYWWERSPYTNGSNLFCRVTPSGAADATGAGASYGVCFGFCI